MVVGKNVTLRTTTNAAEASARAASNAPGVEYGSGGSTSRFGWLSDAFGTSQPSTNTGGAWGDIALGYRSAYEDQLNRNPYDPISQRATGTGGAPSYPSRQNLYSNFDAYYDRERQRVADERIASAYAPGRESGGGVSAPNYWDVGEDKLDVRRDTSGRTYAAEDEMLIDRSTYHGLLDDSVLDETIDDMMARLEAERLYARSITDSIVADMMDAASQPYDELLRNNGRSIDDVRGKLDDLQKITDYYQQSIVGIWEKAAKAGSEMNGDVIRAQIAPWIAEIGKGYDLANANVQSYMDRIGGVPIAQQVAVHDGVSELASQFEGMTRDQMSFAARIVDKTGNLYEKQAIWGLANEKWESEKNRFVGNGILTDQLEKLNETRDDIIGDRARAMARTKREADRQYAALDSFPTQEEFTALALQETFADLGVRPQDMDGYMDIIESMRYGSFDLFMREGVDEEGNAILIPHREIKTLADFEREFGRLDPELQDSAWDDFEILQRVMAMQEHSVQEWTKQASYYQAGGGGVASGTGDYYNGGQAPDNLAHHDEARQGIGPYGQRAQFATSMVPVINSKFNVRTSAENDQWRYAVDPQNKDQARNSDHLSGGALDLWVVDGDYDSMNKARDWLSTLPQVSFIRWQSDGHQTHLHVSFHLPGNEGTIPVGSEGLLAGASGASPATEPPRTGGGGSLNITSEQAAAVQTAMRGGMR